MNILNEKLKRYSAGRTLDVGTGRGSFIPVITECFKEYSEIVGIDSSENAVKAASENIKGDKIRFQKMDASELEFEDDSFDTVCISNTLHHIPDMYKVLYEMKRVLKPGGLYIVSEMFSDGQNEKQLSHVFIHHFNAEIDRFNGLFHDITYRRQEIINIVDKLGLNIVDIFDYNTPEEQAAEEEEEDEKSFIDDVVRSLHSRLELVKEYRGYENLKAELEKFESGIYDIGFMGATELMIIGRK